MNLKMLENAEFKLNNLESLKTGSVSDLSGSSTITLTNTDIDIVATSLTLNGQEIKTNIAENPLTEDLDAGGFDIDNVGLISAVEMNVNGVDLEDLSVNVEELNVISNSIVAPGVNDEWKTTITVDANAHTTYAEDIQTLVAWGSSNAVNYSLDHGLSFILTDMTNTGRMSVSYGNGLFVAVGIDNLECFSSVNGINWIALAAPPFLANTAAIHYLGLFIYATKTVNSRIATSTDGVAWTLRSLDFTPYNFAESGDMVVSVGADGMSYSFDGFNWFDSAETEHCRTVVYDSELERFLAMSKDVVGHILISDDGINWVTKVNGFGVAANIMIYVPEYRMYYIARANGVTGGFGLEYTRDPLEEPFRTRALHKPTVQGGGIYSIGFMSDTKQFWIDANTFAWNYNIYSERLGVSGDIVCDDFKVVSINGLNPYGGVYAGLAAGSVINLAAGQTTLLPVSSVGSLNIPANSVKIGDSYHFCVAGTIPVGDAANVVTVELYFGTSIVGTAIVDMENMAASSFEVEIDLTFRSLTSTVSNLEFSYNKTTTKDWRGLRKVDATGVVDCTISNDWDIRATVTNAGTTSIQSQLSSISRRF